MNQLGKNIIFLEPYMRIEILIGGVYLYLLIISVSATKYVFKIHGRVENKI